MSSATHKQMCNDVCVWVKILMTFKFWENLQISSLIRNDVNENDKCFDFLDEQLLN
jgi:hypothetical protein